VVDFGTSATVLASASLLGDEVELTLHLGGSEYPSHMVVSSNFNEVVAVGPGVIKDINEKKVEGKLLASFKRAIELASRHQGTELSISQVPDLLGDYLAKSLDETKRHIGHPSRIIVSVPNSFNHEAVKAIRQGIYKGLEHIGKAPERPEDISVIRESESVAALYLLSDKVGAAPTGSGAAQRFAWTAADGGTAPTEAPRPGERIAVLDIGAGTTDLTIFDVRADRKGLYPSIVLTAGVPIGGVDADVSIYRSTLAVSRQPLTSAGVKAWTTSARVDPLTLIKRIKESSPSFLHDTKEMNSLINSVFGSSTVFPNTISPAAEDIAVRDCTGRLATITGLSVDGLLDLLPTHDRRPTKILLTGRASLLPPVRAAVLAKASATGATVLTLQGYHLKLAVAYGAALALNHDVQRFHSVGATLGRRLLVRWGFEDIAMSPPHLPINAQTSVVWEVNLPHPRTGSSMYNLIEHRAAVPKRLNLSADDIMRVGAAQVLHRFSRDAHVAPTLATDYLVWDPDGGAYSRSVMSRDGTLLIGNPPTGTSDDMNPITGFPIWYPYELDITTDRVGTT
jgi:hypothetical protein